MMSVTKERFEQGMTYQEYRAQMTRNQERFDTTEQRVMLDPEDVAAFRDLPFVVRTLVLAEDWCGDVMNNLPVLGRLAAESGKLDLRIFLRDQNLDIMDQYLKEGKYRSIPVFVFFDENFQEIGHLIERPASVSARHHAFWEDMFAQNPHFGSPDTPIEQLADEVRRETLSKLVEKRKEWQPLEDKELVQEIRRILQHTLQPV